MPRQAQAGAGGIGKGKRKGLSKADIQPILDELKAGLQAIYGPRLRQVVLSGSYARGEADSRSDVEVAPVLDGYDRSAEEVIAWAREFIDVATNYLGPLATRDEV